MTSSTHDVLTRPDDMRRTFALQQAHQWDVKASIAAQRKAKLAQFKAAVEAHADAIVAAVLEDTRKPEGEIRVTEVMNVVGNIQRNIDNLDAWMAPTQITPSLNPNDTAQIVYEARGVCLILGPWNFPLGLTLGPVAAAVAAGNCCLVKLTDLCPATARVAGSILRAAFDESEVALFEGDVSVATALLELPFSHIFFTGSTRVGKLVMAAAAKHLASVTLELGGKSPVIVDEGANIDKIAADLASAKQFNGGQACISPDYVFVRSDQRDRLVAGFKSNVARNLYGEDGAIRKASIAQIVNEANFARVKALVDDAVAQGATIAAGGEMDATDLMIHPTMLTDVTPQMTILQDKIFAPVIPVMTYNTLDQPHVIGRGHHQRRVFTLPRKPATVRRRQPERHGQLSRLLRLQGVFARTRDLPASQALGLAAMPSAAHRRVDQRRIRMPTVSVRPTTS